MGHAIPKIHYGIVPKTANTTNTNVTLTGLVNTDLIEIGMSASGPGIQSGSTVISKTTITVDLSLPATASAVGQEVEFYKLISFDYPPVETKGEKLEAQERRSLALSGLSQVSIDFVEGSRSLNFRFLSSALFLQVLDFYQLWAVYGNSFKYFEDKTTTSFLEYELKKFDFEPEKIASRGTSYVWGVPFQFRRVAF